MSGTSSDANLRKCCRLQQRIDDVLDLLTVLRQAALYRGEQGLQAHR
eukprot:CAMPEP_0177373218 /NCGR_PEP_ID=MMETSP0368-20130122/43482_1 /TAXON_ID=447022 ORGANISM="Scrippsiella hangoei-like, Strain SHHI-4" /NCGR_SAMPLE_ID=MMETSP0368 /ASSEMBLY_ACC=CAM_ASM_000363 /LENGTH=46 /DNA_ID= /DNA_START= /DNA_END= /DNA_ORIENTATION=